MTKIESALQEIHWLGIDTSPLIYLIERHPVFAAPVREVVQRAENAQLDLVTSILTLTEVLTLPMERRGEGVAERYRAILLESPYLHIVAVGIDAAEQAAYLRSKYRLKTPDAVQLAIALQSQCDAFLTNDKELQRVEELPILLVSQLID